MSPRGRFSLKTLLVVILPVLLMIKGVQSDGDCCDHSARLVLAPFPTFRPVYSRGAWERSHPGEAKPWWVRGFYLELCKYTCD
jgi:hypothetical protein